MTSLSLRDHAYDPDRLCADLHISPDHSGRVAVLVEGVSDANTLRPLLHESCVIKETGGKTRALQVLGKLKGKSQTSDIPVLAIVDADNDHVLRVAHEGSVISTDYRDLEAMIFLGPIGERLLGQCVKQSELERIREMSGQSLHERLIQACAAIGACRIANERYQSDIRFRGFPFKDFEDPYLVSIDEERLWVALAETDPRLSAKLRAAVIDSARDIYHSEDVRHQVRGHDLVEMLSRLLKNADLKYSFGKDKSDCEVKSLERALKTAFGPDDFRRTRIYTRLAGWQEKHKRPLLRWEIN